MKKMVSIFLFIILSIFSQEFEVEQLTDSNFIIKNPTFPQYVMNMPDFYYGGDDPKRKVFFEVLEEFETRSISNIAYLEFDHSEFKFEKKVKYITNNNFIQRNISSTNFPKYMVMWETNKNGNWDIEYTVRQENSTWSEPKILFGSSEDETKAKFVNMVEPIYDEEYENKIWITFEKNQKIFLAEFEDSLTNVELIFADTSEYKYTNPVGCVDNSYNNEKIYISAEMTKNEDTQKKIIMTDRKIDSNQWREPVVISDSGNSHNPKFVQIGYFYDLPYILTFEIDDSIRNSINLLYDNDYSNNPYDSKLAELESDKNLSTYDFSSYMYFIVTKQTTITDIIDNFPYVYKTVRNDSAYVVMNNYNYYRKQSFVFTRCNLTRPAVGPIEAYSNGMLSYMVWTDSTEDGINLFGMKRYDILGDVKEEALNKAIQLSQNYPNPFNPTTKIKFTIPNVVKTPYKASLQTKLIVFDILGRKVKTLINKPMQPGNYEIEFDGSKLPSGIYFYRLTSGEFIQARKMMLLK